MKKKIHPEVSPAMPEDACVTAGENTSGDEENSPAFEPPGYKIATVVLTLALIASVAVFLAVRYFENKGALPVTVSTLQAETQPDRSLPVSGDGSAVKGTAVEDAATVNINTADETELQMLPGIGEKRARDIVEFRREYGTFDSPEDIKKVSGIGDAVYEGLKDHIRVNDEG